MKYTSVASLLLLNCVWLTSATHALVVQDPTYATHYRFTESSTFPGTLTANTSSNFLLAGQDLSGIGWSTSDIRKNFTLISPQHFIGAAHFMPAVGSQVSFFNRNGIIETYTVASVEVIQNGDSSNSDLFVGKLESTVSANITHYDIIPNNTNYLDIGSDIFVYGKGTVTTDGPMVGTGTIEAFSYINIGTNQNTVSYNFAYDSVPPPAPDDDNAHFQSGDSGSPSLMIYNGQIAVAGTHTARNPNAEELTYYDNYDTFVGFYEDDLRTILASDGYTLGVVPEPAVSALLCALGSLGVLAVRRKMRSPNPHM